MAMVHSAFPDRGLFSSQHLRDCARDISAQQHRLRFWPLSSQKNPFYDDIENSMQALYAANFSYYATAGSLCRIKALEFDGRRHPDRMVYYDLLIRSVIEQTVKSARVI